MKLLLKGRFTYIPNNIKEIKENFNNKVLNNPNLKFNPITKNF